MIFDCSDLKTEKAFHKNCFEFDSGANVASGEILKNVGEWMKSLNTGQINSATKITMPLMVLQLVFYFQLCDATVNFD